LLPFLLILLFALAFVLSSACTRIVRNLAQSHGWMDTPVLDRHVHTKPIPRIGGVSICLSFLLVVGVALLIARWPQAPLTLPLLPTLKLLAPAVLIFLLGLYDDLRGASPALKFLVQAVAAVMLFFGGFGIHRFDLMSTSDSLQTAIGLPLTIFWVLLITNAFNLIDGLDGLAAGSALFSTIVMFALTLFTPDPMVSLLSVVLAGVISGFLRFNFHPATIFLGDSGSLFIGFLLSALAIAGSQKSPTIVAVSIPLVSLGFPILDVVLSVARRFIGGKPLFRGDRNHIHHKLLKRGFSQREAVLLLYTVTAGFGFISLVMLHHAAAVALILALTGTAVLIGVQQLRYGEFGEMLSLMQYAARRRQRVANHLAVRHAAEVLDSCETITEICRVMQETFQPLGFDGVVVQMLHPNGFSASSFLPMDYESEGKLVYAWSGIGLKQPPWELRLALNSIPAEQWGFVSLVRVTTGKPIELDVNILAGQFCVSLSKAMCRTCTKMEAILESNKRAAESAAKKYATASGIS
jgi:UDP-GlcNAc:undecaprenyl-phosphate/decaprenyl-phosphate GlcNAc-1-phosphate transferase